MNRLHVYYDKTGEAVSDFDLENTFIYGVKRTIKQMPCNLELHYSTSNIFQRIRLGVIRGEIDCDDFVFLYEDPKLGIQYIPVNKYGACPYWPEGFCDVDGNMAESILLGAMKMKKQEHREKRNGH